MIRTRPVFFLCALLCAGTRLFAQASCDAVVRTADGKPVAEAVVSLTPLDGQTLPALNPPAAPAARISQIGQEYEPLVTPVRTGSPVEFPNLDTVQHHVYSVSKPKRFEIPLYDRGRSEIVVFDQPGVVTLGCNIHDWMLAYVVVLDTPWFAKTSAEGRAALANVPSGRYRLDLWHPRLAKPLQREVTITSGPAAASEEFTVTLRPDRRPRRAPAPGTGSAY